MPPPDQGIRVLVVDDEPAVLQTVAAILEHSGFTVLAAQSGRDAVAIVRDQPEAVTVLLTDVLMPGIGGVELAEKVREIAPRLPIVFMSGYSAMASPLGPLIPKPFKPANLVATIESVISASRKGPRRDEPRDATTSAAFPA